MQVTYYCQGSEIASRKLTLNGHMAGVEESKYCTNKCLLFLIRGTLKTKTRIILKCFLGKYITVVRAGLKRLDVGLLATYDIHVLKIPGSAAKLLKLSTSFENALRFTYLGKM